MDQNISQPEKQDTEAPIPARRKRRISRNRCKWLCVTWSLTWWIPSIFLYYCGNMKSRAVRMAWREKVALCIIFFLLSLALLFLLIGFGPVICPKLNIHTVAEVNAMKDASHPVVYAYGRVYQISNVISSHQSGYGVQSYQFDSLLGNDVSNLFFKQKLFKQYCPGLPVPDPNWDNLINRPKTVAYSHQAIDPSTGSQKMYLEYMNRYAIARIVWPSEYVKKVSSPRKKLIIIGPNVYDVSSYFNSRVKFLGPYVEALLGNFYGKDATPQWQQIVKQNISEAQAYMNCMNNLFYIGQVDQRGSFRCQLQDYVLLTFTAILCLVICCKFLAAVQCVGDSEPEQFDSYVIINIPVYSEGIESIQNSLESIACSGYDDSRKILFIVADGMVTGAGNDSPTYQILLEVLGVSEMQDAQYESFQYESLGEGEDMVNRAVVYSGLYTPFENKSIPFIVVIKVGNETEKGSSAGNRGKRDSQLILLRFLSRCHFNDFMNPLEIAIRISMQNNLGIDPNQLEYLLMVDADTTIEVNSINHLVATMVHNQKIAGLCGETLIANREENWVTMIQVYEYFISHHLAKAFESLFGSVTCLPGCFCFYRLRTLKGRPLIISSALLKAYARDKVNTLHMRNLLQLGEDRYLTTLMLSHFPSMKICFTPRAKCKTIVPDQWSVLLSQRRRWINSTVHNLWELMSLKQLCGCFCFSMRFIVLMDLLSTILQPAGILYIGYLIYTMITETTAFPIISVIMLAGAYGLQVLIFVFKREWAQIGWMVVYLAAMPVVGFLLPLYSFWHFDDFRWGKTRNIESEEDLFENRMERQHIPMAKFEAQELSSRRQSIDSKIRLWQSQNESNFMDPPADSLPSKSAVINQQPRAVRSPSIHSSSRSISTSSFFTSPSSMASRRSHAAMPMLTPIPKVIKPAIPSNQELFAELRCLLNELDLTCTTKKQVRLRLEEKFQCDLSSKKDLISTYINQITGK